MNIKGFRVGSDLYKENIKNIVTKQAQGFLLASFFGSFFGSFIMGMIIIFLI